MLPCAFMCQMKYILDFIMFYCMKRYIWRPCSSTAARVDVIMSFAEQISTSAAADELQSPMCYNEHIQTQSSNIREPIIIDFITLSGQ